VFFYLVGIVFWKLLFLWHNQVEGFGKPILQGLRLDISMICGIFLVGLLPYLLYLAFGWRIWMVLLKGVHIILWIFVCIVEFSSVLIYKEWGSTLDSRAISYLLHPQEAWASVKDFIPFWVIFFGLLIFVSGIKRLSMLFKDWSPMRSHYIQSILFLIIIGPLAFLGLRGGWQKLPIVPSDAFYSSDMKNNFAATNKVWYFLYSLKKSTKISTEYSDAIIQDYTFNYKHKTCGTDSLSNSWSQKNVVVIVTEGWSADMVSYLFGKEKVTPFFDSLSNQSIRFTNAFTTGFRTDQGLMSIISGIPSIQSVNMPNVLDKVKNYASLPNSMKSTGRATSFIYGGDLNFSNLYNYLTTMGFDTIIRDKDFDVDDRVTAWGVPDHITVGKAVDVMSAHKELFYSALLLLSSHAPFEVPVPNEFTNQEGHRMQYMSSVRYSDMALQRFFSLAKTKDWYQNTVFIITSDHGSTHSGWAGMEDHNRFRIPLIVFDPQNVASNKDVENNIPCNHFDLPKTISQNIGAVDTSFIFGRNIFCQDSSRKAFWNVDVASGYYGLSDNKIVSSVNSRDTMPSESALFFDMVKTWFNGL
jgi:phosphoglycerol transferase MdoB-like AlkP superfamily enzyme